MGLRTNLKTRTCLFCILSIKPIASDFVLPIPFIPVKLSLFRNFRVFRGQCLYLTPVRLAHSSRQEHKEKTETYFSAADTI